MTSSTHIRLEDRGGVMVVVHPDGKCHPSNRTERALWDRICELEAHVSAYEALTPEGLHPATAALVYSFSVALGKKLAEAQEKYGHTDEWARSGWEDECRAQLLAHVAKGDPLDVAAYCAFLWHHGEPTAVYPPRWLPMWMAPKDGTVIQLLIRKSDLPDCIDAEEDGELSRTIGFNNLGHDGEDDWHVVGWSWTHDLFADVAEAGINPVGWLPMAELPGSEQAKQMEAPHDDQ